MMRGIALALVLALPASPRSARPPPRPLPPLGFLPSIPRVRLEIARDEAVVVEEVDLPRGDWHFGNLDFYVAFGAPGAPAAFDAHLIAVRDGALAPAEGDAGEKLTVDRAPHRPTSAHPLIGPDEMAGVVVHVPEGLFRRAVAAGGMAALRLRTLLRLPGEDAAGGREILVRLGSAGATPLTLGEIAIGATAGAPPLIRAAARLCGDDADPWPLAVTVVPRPASTPAPGRPAPIAPVLAARRATDDLCVRFWRSG